MGDWTPEQIETSRREWRKFGRVLEGGIGYIAALDEIECLQALVADNAAAAVENGELFIRRKQQVQRCEKLLRDSATALHDLINCYLDYLDLAHRTEFPTVRAKGAMDAAIITRDCIRAELGDSDA